MPPLLLATAALLVPCVPTLDVGLQFERSRIAAGDWHRLLTCHLTHFGASHLAWDVIVLMVLGVVAGAIDARKTLAAIGVSMVAIPTAIWFAQPSLQIYRGLSGIDSALFTLLAVMLLRQAMQNDRHALAATLGLGLMAFVAKLIFESVSGRTVFVDSATAFRPVPLAHGVGAICGVAAGCSLAKRHTILTYGQPP